MGDLTCLLGTRQESSAHILEYAVTSTILKSVCTFHVTGTHLETIAVDDVSGYIYWSKYTRIYRTTVYDPKSNGTPFTDASKS